MKSNFKADINVEAEVSKFIDKYMYPKIGDSFERQYSKEKQRKGIDIILHSGGSQLQTDDKCAFYYANKNLSTFAFELSFQYRDVMRKGWFINSELLTTHYNLMWLNTKDKDIDVKNITCDDIEDIEAIMVPKERVLSYLVEQGYTLEKLTELNQQIRESNVTRERLTPHVELIISNHIAEQPVNIKIDKSELAKLAVYHLKVTEEKLWDLRNKSLFTSSPTDNLVKSRGYKAEQKVLDAVRDYSIGRDCFPFPHFPLHKYGYQGKKEIDILLVDRHKGLTVIEVKGLNINQIVSIQGGTWYYKGFYREVGDPYKQGVDQLDELCYKLEKDPLLFRRFSKRVVVALPYITRVEWEARGFHKLINTPPVLLKDDLESVEGIKNIESYYIYNTDHSLDDHQWMLMKNFFSVEDEHSYDYEEYYSSLYVLGAENQFKQKKSEIERRLRKGTKVTLLCYFDMDATWLEKWEAYEDAYMLQVFKSRATASINNELVINDGEPLIDESIANDFKTFNLKQYETVHAPVKQKLMVTAGAGTGKTHVMIDRILFLLAKGVTLKDIIMITFTNDSTNEMKERLQNKLVELAKLTGQTKFGLFAEDIKEMQISTIHSFSKSILTSLAHEIGYGRNVRLRSFVQEKKEIIGELIDNFYRAEPNATSIHSVKHYELVSIIKKFWDEMEKKGLSKEEVKDLDWGNATKSSHQLIHELFKFVFEHAEDKLDDVKKRENAVSMNDLIRKIKDFSHHKNKMKQLKQNKYLFMDEFQDSDNVQIDLVASLANYLDYSLFVVGDVKQSIYRFRGADYKSFDLLDKKVKVKQKEKKPFREITLHQNYRTFSSILDKLDGLFVEWGKKDWLSYDMKLTGMKERQSKANEFQFIAAKKDDAKEAVNDAIHHSLELTKKMPDNENKKIALIVRTNAQAQEVAKWCQDKGIGTMQNLDGTFYTSEAVRDFKSLLDGLLYPNDAKYVVNSLQSPYFRYKIPYQVLLPFSGDSQKILDFIYSKISDDFQQYVNLLKVYPVMAVVQKILSEKAVLHHLADFYGNRFDNDEDEENFVLKYKKNLFHLMNIIQQQFDPMNASLYNIYEWLVLQMRTNRNENEPMVETKNQSVEITTVHRSKGLEYHTVILPKTTNRFDNQRTTFYIEEEDEAKGPRQKVAWYIKDLNAHSTHYEELQAYDQNEANKEETRLLYVAMTRVRERLVVVMPKRVQPNTWSELIDQTGVKVMPYER